MQAKLMIVQGRAGRREVVLTLPATIGRRAHQTLQILHPTVSREHCELVEQNGQILVRDKQSANGTWIGNTRITEALLKPGDRLTVGPLVFEALYVPGNGAVGTQAAPAKPAAAPQAKSPRPAAAKPTAKAAPQPTPEDDLEAAFAAELLGELGGAAPAEVVDAAAVPTLEEELFPACEAPAPEQAAGDLEFEAIAPDEPSAPWDAIVAEPGADQAIEDEEREVDLAPGDLDLAAGDLGLEEIDLGGLDADASEPVALEGFSLDEGPDLGLPDGDELALDGLKLENDLQFDEELKLDEPDAGASIAADLALEQQLDSPIADDLVVEASVESGAAPAESLDDFFANLQGSEVAGDGDLPAIAIDDLQLDADADGIDFTASDDAAAEPSGYEPASLELGGPELSDELELDLDLGLDDLGVAAGTAAGEDFEIAAGGIVDERDAGPGDEGGLRIAELDLDEPRGLEESASVEELLPPDDAGGLHLDLVVDDEPASVDAAHEQDAADEALHLFLAEESADLGIDEPPSLSGEPAVAADESPPPGAGDLAEPLLDVVTASEPREPSTTDEAAAQGAIHIVEAASSDSGDEIALDADSQELWPVADDQLAADELAIDALGPPEPLADESDSLLEVVSPVAEQESASSKPGQPAEKEPVAAIPTAPDNVDPFDFLAIENSPTAAAEIVEPFVDDDNTPYDPDSPRQRLQVFAIESSALDRDSAAQAESDAALAPEPQAELLPAFDDVQQQPLADLDLPLGESLDEPALAFDSAPPEAADLASDEALIVFDEPQPAAELGPDDHLDAFLSEMDAPPAGELAFDEPNAAEPDQTAGTVPTTGAPAAGVLPADGPDFAALGETVDASAKSLLTLDETSVAELAMLDAPATAPGESPVGELLALSTGDELAPLDDASPALGDLALDDPGLEDLGLGDPGADHAGVSEPLGSPDDFLADLDLPAPPADGLVDDAIAATPDAAGQGEQGSGAFDFLGSATSAAASGAAIGAAGRVGAPLITPPPGSAAAKSEPMWWPFGDKQKSGKPDDTKPTPVAETAAQVPAEPTAAAPAEDRFSFDDTPATELTFDESPAAELPLDAPATDLSPDAPTDDLALDDLALDNLVFEDAEPAAAGDGDLALEHPLAFDDEPSAALGDLGLPSAPEAADEAIAFLDDSDAAPPLDADTASASLQAISDDLATADPMLAALELSELPAANPPGDVTDTSAASAVPARKWWKLWAKSDKPATKVAKPAKPAKIKIDKKAKTGAKAPATATGAPEFEAPTSLPAVGFDDLLAAGAAASALEPALEPALDFEPLELGDPASQAASPGASIDDDNFDIIFAESRPVADEPVVERETAGTPAEMELPEFAADDAGQQVEELAFESLDESAAAELDLPSSREAEPDFMALDTQSADAEDAALDRLFADESSAAASANGAVKDEPSVEPENARAAEPEAALPSAAETVDDNLLDDFFKNF
ncbi:MAG: FHA domain-containing protein [Pirellulales bacterium]|nr:FHA domain-containing protein [Pirellulales bacterium]